MQRSGSEEERKDFSSGEVSGDICKISGGREPDGAVRFAGRAAKLTGF